MTAQYHGYCTGSVRMPHESTVSVRFCLPPCSPKNLTFAAQSVRGLLAMLVRGLCNATYDMYTGYGLTIFMPPLRSSRRHYVFGLSVRPYVRTSRDRVIWRTDWWIPAKLWSCMYLAESMNWLDFGVTRSKVKGHRAHYVCKNSSWSRYLKNRLMDSCQT